MAWKKYAYISLGDYNCVIEYNDSNLLIEPFKGVFTINGDMISNSLPVNEGKIFLGNVMIKTSLDNVMFVEKDIP